MLASSSAKTAAVRRTIGRLDHTVTASNGTLLTVADLVPGECSP